MSKNPILASQPFENLPINLVAEMTIEGTINKTLMLLALMLITAAWTWSQFYLTEDVNTVMSYMWIGTIGGFFVALLTIFMRAKWAWFTAPIYALLEGLAIGGVSVIFESVFPGIVIHAVGLTFGTLFCLLLAYKSGLIVVTEGFIMGVVAVTGAICLLYLIDIVLISFELNVPFIHESGWLGIIFSLFVVIVAALNLVIDFEFIRLGAENGAPKYMEWYSAFALIVTLVWLYLEMLQLLAKIQANK